LSLSRYFSSTLPNDASPISCLALLRPSLAYLAHAPPHSTRSTLRVSSSSSPPASSRLQQQQPQVPRPLASAFVLPPRDSRFHSSQYIRCLEHKASLTMHWRRTKELLWPVTLHYSRCLCRAIFRLRSRTTPLRSPALRSCAQALPISPTLLHTPLAAPFASAAAAVPQRLRVYSSSSRRYLARSRQRLCSPHATHVSTARDIACSSSGAPHLQPQYARWHHHQRECLQRQRLPQLAIYTLFGTQGELDNALAKNQRTSVASNLAL
jgi:hypothetical protein